MKPLFTKIGVALPIVMAIIFFSGGCRFLEMTDDLGPEILGDPIPLEGISYFPWSFRTLEVQYDESLPKEKIDDLRYYFATRVVYFLQAPGKFANSPDYGMAFAALKALGPPQGGGALSPGNSSIVSLGMGGGEIILEFDEPIENEDATVNYKGYDFIVFGNANWPNGKPEEHSQEPGVIWVGVDEKKTGNFLDAKWFVIPGSEIHSGDKQVVQSYSQIAYGVLPENKDWYPNPDIYNDYPPEMPELPQKPTAKWRPFRFFKLDDSICGYVGEEIRGYCDVTPTLRLGDMSGAGKRIISGSTTDSLDDSEDVIDIDPCDFYTIPNNSENWNNSSKLGIDKGSGGGDAIDIDWARDPKNLNTPIDIKEIRWVKIVSGSVKTSKKGDISTEVDAVARVRKMADYNPKYNYTKD